MNKYAWIIIGIIGIHALIAVDPLSAQDINWREEYMAKKTEMMNSIFQELNLSEEQQKLIKEKRDALKQDQQNLRDQIKIKRAALKNELEKEHASKAAVDTITEEVANLIGNSIRQRIDGIWSIKQILTPEQFKILQEKRMALKDKIRKQ